VGVWSGVNGSVLLSFASHPVTTAFRASTQGCRGIYDPPPQGFILVCQRVLESILILLDCPKLAGDTASDKRSSRGFVGLGSLPSFTTQRREATHPVWLVRGYVDV
jgi:hypothetical protein